jgi:diguanylate cyclase (GGDEF)-like protein
LINADIWYRPLERTTIVFTIIVAAMAMFLIFVFLHLSAKNLELEKMHKKITQEEKRGDELQILSETDRMTGLLDRVSGKRKIDDLLSSGAEGMFLELDIDNFKSFNDTFGHQAGDEVILTVADVIKNTFRTNDLSMRLGGDEFGVFAVGIVDRNMGEAIINRLFYMLEKKEVEQLKGEKINLSIGARLCRKEESVTFEKLYADADEALYISKKRKGNSLTFA